MLTGGFEGRGRRDPTSTATWCGCGRHWWRRRFPISRTWRGGRRMCVRRRRRRHGSRRRPSTAAPWRSRATVRGTCTRRCCGERAHTPYPHCGPRRWPPPCSCCCSVARRCRRAMGCRCWCWTGGWCASRRCASARGWVLSTSCARGWTRRSSSSRSTERCAGTFSRPLVCHPFTAWRGGSEAGLGHRIACPASRWRWRYATRGWLLSAGGVALVGAGVGGA